MDDFAPGLAPDPDPLARFERWLADATEAGNPEPNAMVLATVLPGGLPTARTVLLKGLDQRGFVFFTNYESDKGVALATDPACALVFQWPEIVRQVRVTGAATKVSADESDAYFASRPRGSRLGAIASPQSQPIESRQVLDARYAELEVRYAGVDNIPRPRHWGGYRVQPDTIEFWAGRTDRLHDRVRYTARSGGWSTTVLAP